ncbi:hypothetical protein CHLRE_14g630200v5 [Chlamydomonas reinhardtii]|uniref:Uncharacterized protein n=1 Tax=Chlamydomonas reinhardtii TaxID=3055 RepID=A0A2K3CYN1_CHLRE|nr:uncharacterized protein CHLRE_14g630200v5 [Chlamydomonas reinhardtii]PNW73381.1 hypothetical protein CHLRE_14g630200v5 [Chlamydomonas reinhardtii]
MPPPPPPPPSAPNFDSPEYDASQQKHQPGNAEQAVQDLIRGCFDDVLHKLSLAVHEQKAHTRQAGDAVDSCLATCLEVIQMQYPAREDNPVSAVSLEHSSWEQERAPDPCSLDSWLRSALPEAAPPAASSSERDSYIMQQFLSKAPSIRRSLSGRSAGSGALDGEAGGEAGGGGGKAGGGGGGPGTPERHARMSGMGRLAGVSTRSMLHAGASRRHVTKLDTAKRLTAEQEQLEEQLRGELQQRKTQEEMSRRLEAKDAEERSRLSSLRKELKGKDYTYDHKGEVVILNEFDPDRTPLEALSGPGFKVAGPSGDLGDANRALSPKRRGQSMRSHSTRSMAAAEAAAAAAARANNQMSPTEMRRERDRRLASDFKKVQPKTQPSALDTLMPAGGVTLRGSGGATKSGPVRPAQGGLTREAYAKAVAKKAHQAQVAAAEGGGGAPGTPMSPHRMPSMFGGTGTRSGTGTGDILAGSLRGAALGSRGVSVSGAAASAGGGVGSAAAAVAAARAALAEERARDPLAAYEDINYDPFSGARAKARPQSSMGKPNTPDVNISLTGANDWGAPGNGRSYEAPPALPHAKPTDRQLVETVGRGERLPRERAPLPTLAPPLSPSKAGAARNTDRLQFTSVLAE